MKLWIGLVALASLRAASLDEGYGQMYNLQFAQAHKTFQEWQREHPTDPMGPVSDAAAYLFTELERLHILQSEFFAEDTNFLSANKLAPDPQPRARPRRVHA